MGLSNRLRGGGRGSTLSAWGVPPNVPVQVLGGQDDLEVVGELAYQAVLWRLCRGSLGDRFAAISNQHSALHAVQQRVQPANKSHNHSAETNTADCVRTSSAERGRNEATTATSAWSVVVLPYQ